MTRVDLITYGTIAAIISAEHSKWFYEKCNKGYMYTVEQIADVAIFIFQEQKEIESAQGFDWVDWIQENHGKTCTAWDDFITMRGMEELHKLLK